MNKENKNSGFSLVEVLIAIAIFVLCALPLLQAFVLSARTNVSSREALNATTLAENIMEEIKAVGVESYGTKTAATVEIDGNALPVYEAKYINYQYDDKFYTIEAIMTPSTEVYEDSGEKPINSTSVAELYQMDRKRDCIYVQGQDDLWETAKAYKDNHTVSSSVTTADIVNEAETEYRFTINSENGFYTVEQTVTYWYQDIELTDTINTKKIFDSVQTGGMLRSLYLFFLPSQTNRIVIENVKEVPLTVYLVKQSTTDTNVELRVTEGSTPALTSSTRIQTNLNVEGVTAEISRIYRNNVLKTMVEAKGIFGLQALAKESEVTTRLYSVQVDVKDTEGKLLTSLTGTALK